MVALGGPWLRCAVLALTTAGVGAAAHPRSVRCELRVVPAVAGGAAVEAGSPGPWLQMTLANPGPADVRVLNWGTPFEGAWFQPFVQLSVDGAPITYRGAMVKRGDPEPGDYVLLKAGAARKARLDLAEAFDLSRPGRYRVEPRVRLHDVIQGRAPKSRPLAQHQPQSLDCPSVEFSR